MTFVQAPVVVVNTWDGRRIRLSNGGIVTVGSVEDDKGRKFTGVRFELAGAETVRFAMSPEATAALLSLLSDKDAGEKWDMPDDIAQFPAIQWRLVRDDGASDLSAEKDH